MVAGTARRRDSGGHRHMIMRHKMSSAAQPVPQTATTAVTLEKGNLYLYTCISQFLCVFVCVWRFVRKEADIVYACLVVGKCI